MRNQASLAKFGMVAVALATFLFAAAHTASPDANTIAVDSITIAANQLTLKGVFGLGAATVLLGANSLPVVSSSSSEVVATLNPVPHIGTYRVTLTVGNKSATVFAAVSAKILEGLVGADGSISGSGFAASHPFAGHYQVTFPAGTFQIGSPYVFPPVLVTPLFSAAIPNVTSYFIHGDQSGVFDVDFAGIDTAFSFNLTQTY
jgi:hypothetical protein